MRERGICKRCQERYSPRQFPRGVAYYPGGRWSTNPWFRFMYLFRKYVF